MSLFTADEFREIFDVVEQIGDTRISFCLDSATDELRTIVGDAATDDTILAAPTVPTRAGTLKRGHSYLAAARMVSMTGVRMRPFGLAKTEKDLDANVSTNGQTEYQSQKDVDMAVARLHAEAEKILEPYLLTLSGDEDVSYAPEFETGVLTTEEAANCCGTANYC